jgi:23S rRNA (uracil1939-C5)-methyltransferase
MNGRIVLVPYVLPGERVRVETVSERKSLVQAKLAEVLEPSPDRVEPPCPYFGRCGGCHYQHMPYGRQLSEKAAILREVFSRIGKLELPEDLRVISGEPWNYRNRSQFHLFRGAIGYLEAGSHRLCPVDHCPISSPRINEALGALIEMMREPRFPQFLRALEVFTNEFDVQLNVRETERPIARSFFDWCADRIPGYVTGALEYTASGERFRVSPGSFFQVNRFLVDAMVEAAIDGMAGDSVLDLYAGVGLFTLPLARRFRSVTAVESNGSAYRDLQHNASQAGLEIRSVHGSSEAFLALAQETPDVVLADPPRAGLGKKAAAELLRLRPRSVVIVSCDPSTLARDAAMLVSGGYRIEGVSMVDLFPQTYHIETILRLGRGDYRSVEDAAS